MKNTSEWTSKSDISFDEHIMKSYEWLLNKEINIEIWSKILHYKFKNKKQLQYIFGKNENFDESKFHFFIDIL